MTSQSDELRAYVRRAIEAGGTRPEIRDSLAAAGWDEPQIARALDAWAEVPGPLAVPRPRAQLTAREAFLYLVLFAALYLTAWHLGALIFQLIEIAVADPLEQEWRWRGRGDSIRWSVAALLVGAPLYTWLTLKMEREMAADPVRRHSPVRQWLGHMTMFVAALVVIGALVTTIYSLLDGALTLRFVLKVLTVAGIATVIFGYYRAELRTETG
ncbi:MAG TPA: DUF5671 domain-containing protein [Paracoccaceae bacterium]|nr:DUF5671 domain-containing protein [Paracoccaceae bacterium]